MRRTTFSLFRAFSLLSIVFCFCLATYGQFGSGVQGVVTDGAGSAVPGAAVVLTNTGTNARLETTTNDSGFYSFANLPQGTYQIVVTQSGFKRKIVTSANVAAESIVRFDIALEVGEVSAEVTVDGSDAAPLETETANVSRNITSREITELPQVGRDPYQLVRLAPGVFGDGARTAGGASARLGNSSQSGPGASNNGIFAVENQVQVSANGQRVTSNNFEIDGVSVNSQTWGGAAVITPSQESISEVQVTSSTYSAEDGRNSGAHVKVITKYGTNEWSGSGFFKINDPSLNAYNKFFGIPGIVSASPTRVGDKYKTYGGSFGGPIVRDKLFFFFSYEGTRNATNNVTSATFVETAAFRQAIASLRGNTLVGEMLANGAEPRIAQVFNSTPSGVTNLCSLLINDYNNPARCQVVNGGLDVGSITGTYGTYVPNAANFTGGGLDGIADLQYVSLENASSFRGNQFGTRVDYQATANDRITFTSNFTPLKSSTYNTAAQSRPQADLNSNRLTYLIGGIYNKVFSPALLNDFRFNYTKWGFNEIDSNPETDWGIPRVEIEAIWGDRLRFGAPRGETTPGFFDQKTIDFRNTLTKFWGDHSIKIGGQYRKEINTSGAPGGARPLYSFTRMWNFANGTPVFQSINADAEGNPKANDVPFNAGNIAVFVQDDWKFTPNLSLNLGLRWEFFQPIRAGDGGEFGRLRLGNDLKDSVIERVTELTEKDLNNFAPQLGFAWSPSRFDSKLVIRGGWGMGYDRLASALFSNVRFAPPNAARYGICCGSSTNPFNATDHNNPASPNYRTGIIEFVSSTDGSIYGYPRNPSIGGGFGPNGGPNFGRVEIYSTPPDLPSAYVFRYSMEAQYELPWRVVGTLGYQGSKGSRFVRILPLHQIYAGGTNAPTFRLVYFASPDVNTSYNALNAGLRKRFSKDFDINANYKFSKSLDTVSVESPCACTNQTYSYDNGTEKGPSDFDVTHYFNLSGTWEPTWFKGEQNIAGDLLSGWSFSPIVTWRGGFPWTPTVGGGIQLSTETTSIGTRRPNVFYGTGPLDNSNSTFLSTGQFPNNRLLVPNPSNPNQMIPICDSPVQNPLGCSNYFLTTRNGTSYATNVPGIGRNVFRGPKYFNVDLSVAKKFVFPESGFFGRAARLDLRFNFFNLFNTLNLASFNAFSNSTRVDNVQFGYPTAAYAGRVGEFQARFSF